MPEFGLDWLRRPAGQAPVVQVGDAALPLVIRRTASARRMTMRLSPDGTEVRITLPRWGRTAEALAFAEGRAEWLAGQLLAQPQARAITPGGMIAYRGHEVVIQHDRAAHRTPLLDGDRLVCGGQLESLERRLRVWLRAEATALMRDDLSGYCQLIERPAPALVLSNAARRWGSCAADGTIRVNWRLVMAPDFVRRSVVAHEVAHLVHFDHSTRFHALLGAIFEGSVAEANSWLRRNGRGLYAAFA